MEKFGLLNLIKTLDALSSNGKTDADAQNKQPETASADEKSDTKTPPPKAELPNVMGDMLLRHEQISNRVKNKR